MTRGRAWLQASRSVWGLVERALLGDPVVPQTPPGSEGHFRANPSVTGCAPFARKYPPARSASVRACVAAASSQ